MQPSSAKFQIDQQRSTLLNYQQDTSKIVVKALKVSQTNANLAQTGLMLEFSLRDGNNWGSFQHRLSQIFQQVLLCDYLPNCILKCHIYILNQNPENIESTIINGVWLCLLRHSLPMHRSIWSLEWRDSEGKSSCVLDLNNPGKILFAQQTGGLPSNVVQQAEKYKKWAIQLLSA